MDKKNKKMDELEYKFVEGKLRCRKKLKRNIYKSYTNKESKSGKPEDEMETNSLHQYIDEYVYQLLEKENLRRLPVPKLLNNSTEHKSFIYVSKDSFENDKLIILVNGCGANVGQWSRSIIINDNLNNGTQMSYIQKAKNLGYGILVLNMNDNLKIFARELDNIINNKDGYEHFKTVWNDYVLSCKAKHIAIIAHESGGDYVLRYGMIFEEQYKDRVFAIALIDSMRVINWNNTKLSSICQSWSNTDVNLELVKTKKRNFMCITSDNKNREKLPILCMKSVFNYIQSRYLHVSKDS